MYISVVLFFSYITFIFMCVFSTEYGFYCSYIAVLVSDHLGLSAKKYNYIEFEFLPRDAR